MATELTGAAIPLRSGPARGGFSTRRAGDLALEAGAGAAWRRFRAAAGLDDRPVVLARQVHGAGVMEIAPGALWRARPTAVEGVFTIGEADALVTAAPGIAVGVATADCLPILLVDAAAGAVGAVHAGWRGIAAGVVPAAVRAIERLGAAPEHLRAFLGPCVAGPCYCVGEDVAEAWRSVPGADRAVRPVDGRPGTWTADLAAAATGALVAAGLRPENIAVDGRCTHCDADLFFSYRRDGPTGRQVAAICLLP